jgi:dolichol-phosphate mannosyltransferase
MFLVSPAPGSLAGPAGSPGPRATSQRVERVFSCPQCQAWYWLGLPHVRVDGGLGLERARATSRQRRAKPVADGMDFGTKAARAPPEGTDRDGVVCRRPGRHRCATIIACTVCYRDRQVDAVPVDAVPSDPVPQQRVVIIMPTYNERQNLESIAGRVRAAVPYADLLVVDDNSPDGSHQPEHLPSLISALGERGADLVIGSRWVPGGKTVNWPKSREILSRGANLYVRMMLGMGVHDATAGFRAYRAQTLRAINLGTVQSTGYSFQIDLTVRVFQAGLTITEVPITFVEREHGASKMSRSIIMESFWRVAQWGTASRLRRLTGKGRLAGKAG